ncbi:MAG: hypothetical protein KAY24_18650 [Candidatus Eisenbacteria sp.]|nr:hypothetical protein [Candidatus Eisenbacteria bacterium]
MLWPDAAVGPNGDVFVAWLDTNVGTQPNYDGQIMVDRSTDGGATFGVDVQAATLWTVPGMLTNIIGGPTYIAMSYPSIEVDPGDPSRVCVAYPADPGLSPALETRLDSSDPPGAGMSTMPDPLSARSAMSASGGGWFYSVWQDDRNGRNDVYFNGTQSTNPTWPNPDVYLACLEPQNTTFNANVRITNSSITSPPSMWLGDYIWVDVDPSLAHMAWTDTANEPQGDIFYDNWENPTAPQTGACCTTVGGAQGPPGVVGLCRSRPGRRLRDPALLHSE